MRKNLDGGLLHAMHAFLKVIDSGSFTAAAEQMDLTTAQVSRLISELETRLGTKLIQRSTRQQALTDIGATYAERCRFFISMVDEAEAEVTGTASKPKGRLRVLSMGSFGHHYVFPVMAEFCKHYPELTVEYTTSQYVPDLLAKGVDVSLYLTESLTDPRFVA
ncbi:LysR family transcriptional regulator, partial [Klebsiella pneumoniae]